MIVHDPHHELRTARDASLLPVVFLNGQRGVDFDGVEDGFVGEGFLIMGTTMKESLVSRPFFVDEIRTANSLISLT